MRQGSIRDLDLARYHFRDVVFSAGFLFTNERITNVPKVLSVRHSFGLVHIPVPNRNILVIKKKRITSVCV